MPNIPAAMRPNGQGPTSISHASMLNIPNSINAENIFFS
jgi:hypothetical protein